MSLIRKAFFEAAHHATGLLNQPELADHWDEPSALPEFSVAALAGHLLRGMATVEIYLEKPTPAANPIGAVEYYLSAGLTSDPHSTLNRDIRARGAQMSSRGAVEVASTARSVLQRLQAGLPSQPPDRCLTVLGGVCITLDEYLRTRVVELVIHADDLALSCGAMVYPPLGRATTGVAIDTLVDLARVRHGDVAVCRALTRRERDGIEALRVL